MPESPRFDLVFSGRILPQYELQQVKANLQRLFNANQAQLDKMFAGEPVVLKSRLSEDDAQKYSQALTRQGAECELRIRPVYEASSESQPASNAQTAATEVSIDKAVEHSVIDDILAGINWQLAPVGSRMGPELESPPADILQTVNFDLAPSGSMIGAGKAEPTPVLPDISHLSISS